jgi:hypothetical protein
MKLDGSLVSLTTRDLSLLLVILTLTFQIPNHVSTRTQVLTALSAIGNSGQSGGTDILRRCLNDRLPSEVRVAAAQAFRRMPCDADVSE